MLEAEPDPIGARRTAAERRVAALASYGILDGNSDAGLDALAALAAQICDVPIAAVTLLDAERQWFKAISGSDVQYTEIDSAFCLPALDTPDQVFVVPDATADPRFAGNRLVIGFPGIRSYAGAPLVTSDGVPLGAMCAIDCQPRQLTPSQLPALSALARLAVELLEARRNTDRIAVAAQEREEALHLAAATESSFRAVFDHAAVGMLLVGLDGYITQANQAFATMIGRTAQQLPDESFSTITEAEDLSGEVALMTQLVAGKSRSVVREKRYLHCDGHAITAVSSTTAVRDADGVVTSLLSQVESIEDRRRAEHSLLETQSAIDAIITADADGLITAWNGGAERLFGHRRSQALGQPMTIIVPQPLGAADAMPLAVDVDVGVRGAAPLHRRRARHHRTPRPARRAGTPGEHRCADGRGQPELVRPRGRGHAPDAAVWSRERVGP